MYQFGNLSPFNLDRYASVQQVPVVPAGVTSLKRLTTSSLLEHLAFRARQRTILLVSGSGCSRQDWSNCRSSWSRFTTSCASHDCDKRATSTEEDKARACPSLVSIPCGSGSGFSKEVSLNCRSSCSRTTTSCESHSCDGRTPWAVKGTERACPLLIPSSQTANKNKSQKLR